MSQKTAMHGQPVILERVNAVNGARDYVYLAILDWQNPDPDYPAGNAMFARKEFLRWVSKELDVTIKEKKK